MPWGTSTGWRSPRVDVRLAVLLAGATAAFTSLLLCGLLAFALLEALEEEGAMVDDAIAAARSAGVEQGAAPVVPVHHGVAYRIVDAAGETHAGGAPWPPAGTLRDVSLATALTASGDDFLGRQRPGANGAVVAAALPLRHFVRERRELVARGAVVVMLGLVGSIALGVLAARRALRPLHEAFARMSAFSADVAHELRTHVNRVLNGAEVALGTSRDAAAKDDALAAIHDTAEEMRRVIEQLLLLAKGEEGRLPVTRGPVDLGTLLTELVGFYAPAAERVGKTLSLVPAPLVVPADRALIEHALANLLENALQHSAREATIHVAATARDGMIAVVVEDSGPGIAAADAARIFDRFVRLDAARGGSGAGLGLPIARMIARLHHGDVTVARSVLGGAAFRLTLAA